jgi:hypothetical protein
MVDRGCDPDPVTTDALPVDPDLAALLRAMDPDPRAVHTLLAPRIGPATVDELAAADYGHDLPAHRAALTALLADPDPPTHLEWAPHEVLVLTLGHGPGDVVDLWSGSVLLGAATPYEEPLLRLPAFLRAALSLGGAELAAARRFLAWCRLTAPGDWRVTPRDLPYVTFGVLLLSVAGSVAGAPVPSGDVLRALAAGLVEELDRSVYEGEWIGRAEPPLIGRGPRKPGRAWRDLAARVLVDGPLAGTAVGERLAVLGRTVTRERALPVEDLYGVFLP